MTPNDQLKNILAFLCIIFGEDLILSSELMDKSPKYLLEKWERYIKSEIPESEWGMHPSLRRRVFERYLEKWEIEDDNQQQTNTAID